jgi:hypothetical protein
MIEDCSSFFSDMWNLVRTIRGCPQAQFFSQKNTKNIPFPPEKRYLRRSAWRSTVQGSRHTWTLQKNTVLNTVSFPPLNSPIHVPCVNLFTSTMEPNFDGQADPFDANTDVVESISDTHAAAGTYWNAKRVFLSKNSSLRSLIVLSIGLKNDDGINLVDLEIDPWKSLPTNSTKQQKEDYADKICRRYVVENLQGSCKYEERAQTKGMGCQLLPGD